MVVRQLLGACKYRYRIVSYRVRKSVRYFGVLCLNAYTDQVVFWQQGYHRGRLLCVKCGSGYRRGKGHFPVKAYVHRIGRTSTSVKSTT